VQAGNKGQGSLCTAKHVPAAKLHLQIHDLLCSLQLICRHCCCRFLLQFDIVFDNGEARARIKAALAGVGVATAFTLLRCQACIPFFKTPSSVTMRHTVLMYGGMCRRPYGQDLPPHTLKMLPHLCATHPGSPSKLDPTFGTRSVTSGRTWRRPQWQVRRTAGLHPTAAACLLS
jgi:hypothetical protein